MLSEIYAFVLHAKRLRVTVNNHRVVTTIVLCTIEGIYKVALTHKKLGVTKELLANRVVPFLFPLCIDSGLNLAQVGFVLTF